MRTRTAALTRTQISLALVGLGGLLILCGVGVKLFVANANPRVVLALGLLLMGGGIWSRE